MRARRATAAANMMMVVERLLTDTDVGGDDYRKDDRAFKEYHSK